MNWFFVCKTNNKFRKSLKWIKNNIFKKDGYNMLSWFCVIIFFLNILKIVFILVRKIQAYLFTFFVE